ncbi:beta-defensin 128 [Tenrec ecaudatus]|uniref:beta-defensin 128 n=1 Tax=Tenrec ecaudatus TaxID=94439 RepID=UPI003F5994AD
MKLILVLIILLCDVSTERTRFKKCFNNIEGYCRKRCKLGEIYEVACRNGKLCCVNEGSNKLYHERQRLPEIPQDINASLDYLVLPTITVVTINYN